jgi:hypothetical protein
VGRLYDDVNVLHPEEGSPDAEHNTGYERKR